MAHEVNVVKVTVPASGDLSSNQYLLCTRSTSGQLSLQTTRGGLVYGVQEGNSTAAGISTSVKVGGRVKMWVGTSSDSEITPGAALVCSSAGTGIIASTAVSFIFGRAAEVHSSESTGIIAVDLTFEGWTS